MLDQLIALGLTIAAFAVLPFGEQPLRPWTTVGSATYIHVVNTGFDTLRVDASAPEVDSAIRRIGVVAPGAESFIRLPYADCRVSLVLHSPTGSRTIELNVTKPGVIELPKERQ